MTLGSRYNDRIIIREPDYVYFCSLLGWFPVHWIVRTSAITYFFASPLRVHYSGIILYIYYFIFACSLNFFVNKNGRITICAPVLDLFLGFFVYIKLLFLDRLSISKHESENKMFLSLIVYFLQPFWLWKFFLMTKNAILKWL